MGPGIALLALASRRRCPIALIFCFENIMHFTIAPMMMAVSGDDNASAVRSWRCGVAKRISLAPVHHRHGGGVAAAVFAFHPPTPIGSLLDYLAKAAAPCALFAMGVSLALRPLKRVPKELCLDRLRSSWSSTRSLSISF